MIVSQTEMISVCQYRDHCEAHHGQIDLEIEVNCFFSSQSSKPLQRMGSRHSWIDGMFSITDFNAAAN